jgi:hypothetical protein
VDVSEYGASTFKLVLPPSAEYLMECGSPEEKLYWMDVIKKCSGFKPTSQLQK